MTTAPRRHHLPHSEIPGGTCHITWRLHREQRPLTSEERTIIMDILRRALEFGATVHAAVVMDDHVHVLFTPGALRVSGKFISSWKGASGRLITVASARTAPLWQAEYYLRWISSPRLIDLCASYIRQNPRRKWPGIGEYPWGL